MFSDENKINLFSSDGSTYARRRVNEALNPRNTVVAVKHGVGHIKLWGCFSCNGVGHIF